MQPAVPRSRDILVVEDDFAVRDALVEILEFEGFSTVPVSNGREALRYLRQAGRTPGLILLDLLMPEMDGWQLRNELRRDVALGSIPTILLSADRDAERHVATLDAQGFLEKPVRMETLLGVVRRYCLPDVAR